jgi:uncharacterized YigZ family protein
MNNIKTIAAYCESRLREKGSVFLGNAYPLTNKEEAENILNQIRKKYFDATHHCYAFSIYTGDSKYSDAGEPSGTAGIRIMNAIEHFGLTNILVVVVRYFGGTKLGVGPLGRAYYNSAALTIESSRIIEKIPAKKIFIETEPAFAKQVKKILASMNAETISSRFEDKMRTECFADINSADQLIHRIQEATRNKSEIKIEEKITFI